MHYIVEFHADGGQMCVFGRRSFKDCEKEKAEKFAEEKRSEPGHSCGSKSVKFYTSENDLENEGCEYPLISNSGRNSQKLKEEKRDEL